MIKSYDGWELLTSAHGSRESNVELAGLPLMYDYQQAISGPEIKDPGSGNAEHVLDARMSPTE